MYCVTRNFRFIYFKGDQSIEYELPDWRVPEINCTSKNIEKCPAHHIT